MPGSFSVGSCTSIFTHIIWRSDFHGLLPRYHDHQSLPGYLWFSLDGDRNHWLFSKQWSQFSSMVIRALPNMNRVTRLWTKMSLLRLSCVFLLFYASLPWQTCSTSSERPLCARLHGSSWSSLPFCQCFECTRSRCVDCSSLKIPRSSCSFLAFIHRPFVIGNHGT